ncbi:hypothetical protein [Litoribacter populi]|uniref:hypothetical protein n=1 Tax=Litoribacter populi TaxID=2598460 RepID=UPI00117CE7AF|nr:hypothetical protein [Litoribacter populi]
MKNALIVILVSMFALSCAAIKRGPADAYKDYSEDLSETRVTFPELPDPDEMESESSVAKGAGSPVDEDLEEAIGYFKRDNEDKQYYNGFTILVYSGVDRDKAFETRNDLYTTHPDVKADMQYQQPRYLVKVGQYVNRIEAQSLYYKIKEDFPSARIIQDRFERDGFEENDIEDDFDAER